MVVHVAMCVVDLVLRSVPLVRVVIVFDGVGTGCQSVTGRDRWLQLTPPASDHESEFGVPVGSIQRYVGQEVDGR